MSSVDLQQVLDFVVSHRASQTPPRYLAEVLDELSWLLDEATVKALSQTRERWLTGDDLYKVQIALEMQSTYPFTTFEEMRVALDAVAAKWPKLAGQCSALLKRRRDEPWADDD